MRWSHELAFFCRFKRDRPDPRGQVQTSRSAAAGSIFNCPTLTLILIISVFRSLAAFIGVFFIDGILIPYAQCGHIVN
jgi:hypothetical protein